jgi:hypothetical protein
MRQDFKRELARKVATAGQIRMRKPVRNDEA